MRRGLVLGTTVALPACTLFWGLDNLDSASGSSVDAADGSTAEAAPHDTGAADATLATDGSCTPATPATLDDCTALVPLAAAPVIDGLLDCGVPLWPIPMLGWTGPGALPPTARAQLAGAWRPDGLYFFVHVTGLGPTRYPAPSGTHTFCGDAVELYADDDGQYTNPTQYDDPGTIQLIAGAPSNSMTTVATGEMWRAGNNIAPWTGQYLSVRTSDGFDLEAFVVAADLGLSTWTLAQGAHVGLDVAVDLGDPTMPATTCPRLGQFMMQIPDPEAGGCNRAACNTSAFCNPTIASGP
jgi:hypothetical protein